MGWNYSAPYLSGRTHSVMSSATNECMYFPWQAEIPLFWIYGQQGDGLFANTGDAYSVDTDLQDEQELLYISAGIYKNPYAAWLAKPTKIRSPESCMLIRALGRLHRMIKQYRYL